MNTNAMFRGFSFVFASLLIPIVLLLTTGYTQHEAHGSFVLLPHVCTLEERAREGDGRPVWIRLLPDGRTFMNDTEISRESVASLTWQAMSTRQERLVTLIGAPGLSYGEVIHVAAMMQATTPFLNIFLVTDSEVQDANPCLRLSSTDGFVSG